MDRGVMASSSNFDSDDRNKYIISSGANTVSEVELTHSLRSKSSNTIYLQFSSNSQTRRKISEEFLRNPLPWRNSDLRRHLRISRLGFVSLEMTILLFYILSCEARQYIEQRLPCKSTFDTRRNLGMTSDILTAFSGLLIVVALLAACRPVSGAAAFHSAPDAVEWIAQDYAPAPAANPLKGFLPFYDAYGSAENPVKNDFPHSMEFFYVPLKNLMNGPDSFTFDTGLEPQLISISGRGHQAIFRVYLDYPGRVSGIPGFLRKGGLKVRNYPYFGNLPTLSLSPDYDDPALIATLESFIAALGERYDGDPRIGFIQIGLLGFWGEWHTWPQDGYTQETALLKAQKDPKEENWFASEETQLRILNAFDAAFDQTRILLRYPMVKSRGQEAAPYRRTVYQSVNMNIGYHDDSFAYETAFGADWYFMSRMQWRGAIDKWKTEPIGGELRPEIQLGVWLDPPSQNAENFIPSVDATHVSWLIAHSMFTSSTLRSGSDVYNRALDGARHMGYEFYVSAVRITPPASGNPLDVRIRIENNGVAPFYYDWPLELGLLDSAGNLVDHWQTVWKLTGVVLPGDPGARYTEWSDSYAGVADLPAGTYQALLRVVNPLQNGTPFAFANRLQDAGLKGWLTLGTFIIQK